MAVFAADETYDARGGVGMNRWLSRSLWLLAWSGWAWLGVGLYRELPRDLGPMVRHLPIKELGATVWGFLDGKPMVVMQERLPSYTWPVSIWDPRTGERRRTLKTRSNAYEYGPPVKYSSTLRFIWSNPALNSAYDAVVSVCFSQPSTAQFNSSEAIYDLVSGRRTKFTGVSQDPIGHPTKAWAAFWSATTLRPGDNYVVVVDLALGTRIFEWRESPTQRRVAGVAGQPFFVGTDRIGVPIYSDPSGADRSETAAVDVEIWTIPPRQAPAVLLKRVSTGNKMIPVGGGYSTSPGGRVAWHRYLESGIGVGVFDVDASSDVFVEPGNEPIDWTRLALGWPHPPLISSDGKSVLNFYGSRLWSIDRKRLLWSASEWERLVHFQADRFEVKETWKYDVGSWSRSYETYAVRSLSTGDVECRTWLPSLKACCNSDDGRRIALVDSDVYELTFPVNYPLLALCQTILALPLILLWAVLRWRRRRRVRLTSVVP